jgi:hypothetical protein
LSFLLQLPAYSCFLKVIQQLLTYTQQYIQPNDNDSYSKLAVFEMLFQIMLFKGPFCFGVFSCKYLQSSSGSTKLLTSAS